MATGGPIQIVRVVEKNTDRDFAPVSVKNEDPFNRFGTGFSAIGTPSQSGSSQSEDVTTKRKPPIGTGSSVGTVTNAITEENVRRLKHEKEPDRMVDETRTVLICGPEESESLESAKEFIHSTIKSFINALGLLICFSCNVGNHLPGTSGTQTYKGARLMVEAFHHLGYATCHIHNPTHAVLDDVCTVLTNFANYPETYNRLFVYFAVHANEKVISILDGTIKIEELMMKFSPGISPRLKDMPIVCIFDGCRGELESGCSWTEAMSLYLRSREEDPSKQKFGKVLIFYSVPPYFKAYTYSNGAPIVTSELVKLFKDRRHRSILDVFDSEISQAVKKATPGLVDLCPQTAGGLGTRIDLHAEREEAMRPRAVEVKLEKRCCTVTWDEPLHREFQHLKVYKLEHINSPTTLLLREGGKETTMFPLRRDEVSIGLKLRVVAEYEDGTRVESESVIVGGNVHTYPRCLVAALLALIFLLLLLLTSILSFTLVPRSFTQTALAGFVVDCNPQHSMALFLFNSVTLSQMSRLGMEVFSIPQDRVVMKESIFNYTYTDFTFTNSTDKQSQSSRPWYFRPGSIITLDFVLSYDHLPDNATIFVARTRQSPPIYHGNFLTDAARIHVNVSVLQTGIYYVFTSRSGGSSVSIDGNITYHYKYIDRSDYTQSDVTHSVRQDDTKDFSFPVYKSNNQVTLCSMSERKYDSDPISTDISLTYVRDLGVQLSTMIIIFLIFLFICIAFLCVCFYRRKICRCSCLVCYRHYTCN